MFSLSLPLLELEWVLVILLTITIMMIVIKTSRIIAKIAPAVLPITPGAFLLEVELSLDSSSSTYICWGVSETISSFSY